MPTISIDKLLQLTPRKQPKASIRKVFITPPSAFAPALSFVPVFLAVPPGSVTNRGAVARYTVWITSVSEKDRSEREINVERCWKAEVADCAMEEREGWAKKGDVLSDLDFRDADSA